MIYKILWIGCNHLPPDGFKEAPAIVLKVSINTNDIPIGTIISGNRN